MSVSVCVCVCVCAAFEKVGGAEESSHYKYNGRKTSSGGFPGFTCSY